VFKTVATTLFNPQNDQNGADFFNTHRPMHSSSRPAESIHRVPNVRSANEKFRFHTLSPGQNLNTPARRRVITPLPIAHWVIGAVVWSVVNWVNGTDLCPTPLWDF
jgi:hypothetical protein